MIAWDVCDMAEYFCFNAKTRPPPSFLWKGEYPQYSDPWPGDGHVTVLMQWDPPWDLFKLEALFTVIQGPISQEQWSCSSPWIWLGKEGPCKHRTKPALPVQCLSVYFKCLLCIFLCDPRVITPLLGTLVSSSKHGNTRVNAKLHNVLKVALRVPEQNKTEGWKLIKAAAIFISTYFE